MERVWRIRLHLHNYFRIFVRKHLQHGKIDVVVGGAECPTQNRVWKRNHDGTNELTSVEAATRTFCSWFLRVMDPKQAHRKTRERASYLSIQHKNEVASLQKRIVGNEQTGEYDHDTTTIQNSQHTTRHSHWDDLVSSRNSRPSPHNAA